MNEDKTIKQALIEILEYKDPKDFDTKTSGVVRAGLGILFLAQFFPEVSPYEYIAYLNSHGIFFTEQDHQKAIKIIQENNLLKDGRFNPADDEDPDSNLTWALMATLLDESLAREIKDGKARYHATQKTLENIQNDTN